MCKDFLSLLQDQDDVGTVRVLQQANRMLLCGCRGRRHSDDRWWRFGWQEGRLEKRPLHVSEVRLPKLQVAAGDESSSDGVIKDILDTKLSDDAGLIIWHTQLLSHLTTPFWRKNLIGLNRPEKKDNEKRLRERKKE